MSMGQKLERNGFMNDSEKEKMIEKVQEFIIKNNIGSEVSVSMSGILIDSDEITSLRLSLSNNISNNIEKIKRNIKIN